MAYRSAAPERHRGGALTLISRGLLLVVPAHACVRTVRSLERSHHDKNCFFLYIYRSWGVFLHWFLLAVMERVKVSAACCGSQSASVFLYVKHLHPRFSLFSISVTSLRFFCSLLVLLGFSLISAFGKKWGDLME